MSQQIPEGAVVARLVMVNGNLVSLAEIASILESYNYEEDPLNPERWNLRWEDPVDEDAALHILQEGEVIDVYSESPENMLNVNHIATRCGWADCELYSSNPTIEQMLMSRTASLNVVKCLTGDNPGLSNDVLAEVALPEPLPLDVLPEDEETLPTQDAFEHFDPALPMNSEGLDAQLIQIQQLTLQLNDAEMRAAQFEDERDTAQQELASLRDEIAALRSARGACAADNGVVAAPATPCGDKRSERNLLRVLEKHLSSMLDLSSVTDSDIAKDLLALGYNIQVQLVKT